MIKHNKTLDFFVDKLKQSINFKFMRFGDGEFLFARGVEYQGTDEHNMFPECTEEYRYILKNMNPKIMNGIQPFCKSIPEIQEWIPKFDWYNADVFHNASIYGELYPFFEALNHRITVIISCERIKKINTIINYSDYICIRDSDCYLDKQFVLKEIEKYPTDTVFVLAASVLTCPVIYSTKRNDITMIDVGSLLEPYIHNYTRNYHRQLSQETIDKNLGKGL
jgi:hypothetical protein